MKKTLVAILALSGMAMATEVSDLTYTSGTLVANLDVTAMKDIAGNGFGGAVDAITLFKFSGVWQNDEAAFLGLVNNGSSQSHKTGFYGNWQKATTTVNNQVISGMTEVFTPATDWDNIVDMAIAYSWNTTDSNTTDIYTSISYITKDGTVTTNSGSLINQMKFSSIPYTMTADTLTVNDTYVANFTYNGEGVTSVASIVALSEGALVPEPATATLSLLALAGLAARRRRH